MGLFLTFIIHILLLKYVSALPFLGEKRAIDSNLLTTFNLMQQYASAAYCANNHNSPGDKLSCGSGRCPLIQIANATSFIEYDSPLSTDVTGYVGVDATNHLIVVAFRGSVSIENWITDLTFNIVPTGLCDGCTSHAGFWQSWLDARTDVLAALQKLVAIYPSYKIVATGHSLGAAVATLAAADLRKRGYTVVLYSFGSPRVAGNTLSNYITNQPGGNYRITHYNDPVPRLPTLFMGYVHISPEYYIKSKNFAQVGTGDISVYSGSKTLFGNAGFLMTDPNAHLWYFDAIANCS